MNKFPQRIRSPPLTRTRRTRRRKVRLPKWPSPDGTQVGPGSGQTWLRVECTEGSSSRYKKSSRWYRQSFVSHSVERKARIRVVGTYGNGNVCKTGQSSVPGGGLGIVGRAKWKRLTIRVLRRKQSDMRRRVSTGIFSRGSG